MVVYSKFSKQYKLAGRPAAKAADGSIYDVIGEPGIQVKILDKAYRTDEMERTVEDSIGGMGMLDVTPIEPIYQNNRFAGFVMEKPMTQDFDPVPDPGPAPAPEPSPERAVVTDNGPVPLLVMIAAGIAMTAILILEVFPAISASVDSSVRSVLFGGIPMAAVGWGLMLFVMAKSGGVDWKYAVLGILAFVVGAALCYILISILVYLFFAAKALAIAVLPSIIGFAIVIMIVKSIIGGH